MPRRRTASNDYPGTYRTSDEVKRHKCDSPECAAACAAWLAIPGGPGIADFPAFRAAVCEALQYRIPQA